MQRKTKVINYFGSPGSGKSTLAAGLFFELKMLRFSVELVTEFAKELVYQQRTKCLADQIYVLAQQNHRMSSLLHEVDYIVTDSPLLLSAIYCPKKYPPSFRALVLDMFNQYDNINIFVKRTCPYLKEGRLQTEAQSDAISNLILQLFDMYGIQYVTVNSGEVKQSLDLIIHKTKEEKEQ